MARRRWLTRAGIAAFLVVALVLAFLAYQAMRAPLESSLGLASPSPGVCAPTPCSDVQGFKLWVSNVTVEGNLVRMQVTFKNSSNATHASPEDLSLIDRSHSTSRIVTDGSNCNTWTRHEFNNGAMFGPIEICFHVTNTAPPFTLHWTPDLGFICCETDLTINLS
jgi:hypothetical protein